MFTFVDGCVRVDYSHLRRWLYYWIEANLIGSVRKVINIKIGEMMREIKMSQREFEKLVGYNRTTMYRHDLYGDRLSEGEVEDIKNKVCYYIKNEVNKYNDMIKRMV